MTLHNNYKDPAAFPHLQALCAERGIEKQSLRQVFDDLGLQFDRDGNDVLKIRLNHTVWPGRYLERGRLTAEIEVFDPQIKAWLQARQFCQEAAGKSDRETLKAIDQEGVGKVQQKSTAPSPQSAALVEGCLEVLASGSLPLEWRALLTRLLTRERPFSVRRRIWEGVLHQVHLWLGQDKGQLEEIVQKGWTLGDIFGCHGKKPQNRSDCMGLILLVEEKTIQSVTVESIKIKTSSGAIQSYYKPPPFYQPSDKTSLDLLP